MTLQESIAFNPTTSAKKSRDIILYQTSSLKFSLKKNCYQLDCLNDNIVEREELISFIQFARAIYRIDPYTSLLVDSGKGSSIDIAGWTLLTKVRFNKAAPLKIAFVSDTLYQSLLLKRLQILNETIMVFRDKKTAIKWLQNQNAVSEKNDR